MLERHPRTYLSVAETRPLNPDPPIYRFFDFFALAATIGNRRLRLASPSTFPDKNEGLEVIYNSLRAAVESNDGSYSGITSQEEILRIHNLLKQGSFVCSWTSEADSVALWSLYSADRCSVRISSKLSKLQAALDEFGRRNSLQSQFERYGVIDQHTGEAAFAFVQAVAVKEASYEDLRRTHEDILKRGRSGEVLSDQPGRENFEFLTLKDKAFVHEGEIRGIVTCGLAAPSGSRGSFADSASWLEGDHLYVDIPGDFVESVAIDPRCPRYKREVIEGYLRDHHISLVSSQAFGYLPDELDFVTPRRPPSE